MGLFDNIGAIFKRFGVSRRSDRPSDFEEVIEPPGTSQVGAGNAFDPNSITTTILPDTLETAPDPVITATIPLNPLDPANDPEPISDGNDGLPAPLSGGRGLIRSDDVTPIEDAIATGEDNDTPEPTPVSVEPTPAPEPIVTLALGEDGDLDDPGTPPPEPIDSINEPITTLALGEDGDLDDPGTPLPDPVTTLAIGEDGDQIEPTIPLDPAPEPLPDPVTTLAIGEDGHLDDLLDFDELADGVLPVDATPAAPMEVDLDPVLDSLDTPDSDFGDFADLGAPIDLPVDDGAPDLEDLGE